MPLTVTVVIPTYNRAPLVPRAVESALANIESGDEVIVVDDGSTDGTDAALAPYEGRIRLLHGRHAGAGAARNLGIASARGDLVAFLDSDDAWMPGKLALQKTVLQSRPDVLFCFSDFAVRDLQGRDHHRYLSQWHQDPRPWEQILGTGVLFSELGTLPPAQPDFAVHVGNLFLAQMRADYVCTITVVARRLAAGDALRFAEDVPTYEDWECFGHLCGKGTAAYVDCETAWNYAHPGQRLTDADAHVSTSTRLKILERVWGQDAAFLAQHGDEYARRQAELYRLRVRWLLCQGRTAEARADLRRARNGPLADRFLAHLPSVLTLGLLRLRRVFRTT